MKNETVVKVMKLVVAVLISIFLKILLLQQIECRILEEPPGTI